MQISEAAKAIQTHLIELGHDVLAIRFSGFNDHIESDGYVTLSHVVTFTPNGKDLDVINQSLCTITAKRSELNVVVGQSGFYPVICERAIEWLIGPGVK
jgi:hypothetical protein